MSIERFYYAESDLTFESNVCVDCGESETVKTGGYDIMDRQTGLRVAWCEHFDDAINITSRLNR